MGMGFAPTWLRQMSPLLHKTTLTTGQNTLIKGRLSPANWAARWRTLLVVCWLQVHRVLNVKRFILYCALKYTKLPSRACNLVSGLTHERTEFQTYVSGTDAEGFRPGASGKFDLHHRHQRHRRRHHHPYICVPYICWAWVHVPYTNSSTVRVNRPIKKCPRTSKAWQH